MTASAFTLDPRLHHDTHFVCALALCNVLLMNDARYAWLILVPRVDGATEVLDLSPHQRHQLWRETEHVCAVLRDVAPCDKLNIGALGNIVQQLHVHVLARVSGDPAWPGPVWGHSAAQPYEQQTLRLRLDDLHNRLTS